jgi:subtilisin family serine protease
VGSAGSGESWHLDRLGRWDRAAAGDGIVVGIADSWLHPVASALALPVSRVRAFAGDGSVTEPVPLPSSHGTAVASLIASAELGVAPRTSLVFASVLRQADAHGRFRGTSEQVAAGLRWLARASVDGRPVRVVCASFTVDEGPALREVVEEYVAARIVLVAATGNDRVAVGWPAAYPGVVSVGALDRDDRPAASSGRSAPAPDVWAPGVSVCALGALGGRRRVGGTSMAAAIATGAIAAMMGIHDGLDGGNVHAHLAATARRHPSGERCLGIA